MGNGKLYILFICLIVFFTGCKKVSQPSSESTSGIKMYGDRYGDILRSFKPTADGGYVFGGFTNTSANKGEQGFIQKCNKNGTETWFQTYGGANQEIFNIVEPTSDGGFIAAGSSGPSYYQDSAYILKTDGQGIVLWQKYFPGNLLGAYFYDVKETPDHGFAAIGFCYAINENPLYIVRLDQNGDSLWTRKIVNSKHNFVGASVAIGPNGEIAIASSLQDWSDNICYPYFTYLSPDSTATILQKSYSSIGAIPWSNNGNTWQYGASTNFEKIISQSDGFIFIMSTDVQALVGNPACIHCGNPLSITLFKIDFSGKLQWSHSYRDMGNIVVFNDAVSTQSGGLLISGGAVDSAGTNYCWLMNTDANGGRLSQYFIPIYGTKSWAVGAKNTGDTYNIGLTTVPLRTNRVGYFGFLTTDLNGKIIDRTN